MRFNIINYSSNELVMEKEAEVHGMKHWRDNFPKRIAANSKVLIQINFSFFFKGSGKVEYNLGDLKDALTIQAKNMVLQVRWNKEVTEEGNWVYPVPLKGERSWSFKAKNSNAIFSIVIINEVDLPIQKCADSVQEVKEHWMDHLQPLIQNQKIPDLLYAATHDSASYSMKNCLCGCFAKTQKLTIQGQLTNGARTLDLRVGDLGPQKGDDRFIFVHDACYTKVTVRNGLNQVRRFLDRNPTEFVFLGFHRLLSKHGGPFDYKGLADLVEEVFENQDEQYLLHPEFVHKPFGEIMQESTAHARCIICWPVNEEKRPKFWEKIQHLWDRQTIGKVSKNKQFLQEKLKQDLPLYPFHSAQAVIFSLTRGPRKLSPYIEDFFVVDGDQCDHVGMVAVDFIESTWLVDIQIAENIVRFKTNKSKKYI